MKSFLADFLYIAALFVFASTASATDNRPVCRDKKIIFNKTVAAMKNLSLARQVIELDEFLSSVEDSDQCYSKDVYARESKLEIELVRLDANGIQIRPESTAHCYQLEPGQRCGYPDHERRPEGQTPTDSQPIPTDVKTLRVKSQWEKATLIGIYHRDGTPIQHENGVFNRPRDGQTIFALYRIDSPMAYRKFYWTIKSKN